MTYLASIKDGDTISRRINLMKQLSRLQTKFNNLWIEQEGIIAPYNEQQIKDVPKATLEGFLLEFNQVVNGFLSEGMFMNHMNNYYGKFVTKEDTKHYLDTGLLRTFSNFFSKINTTLYGAKRIVNRVVTELENSVASTNLDANLQQTGLRRQDLTLLLKGEDSLVFDNITSIGVLPKLPADALKLLTGDELRESIKPLATEYRHLEQYLSLLIDTWRQSRWEYEEYTLRSQTKLAHLDARMEGFQQQLPTIAEENFSNIQRTLVAKFYMDNKQVNTPRQGSDEELVTKDLYARYEALNYLLHQEYGDTSTLPLLNRIVSKSKTATEILTDREKESLTILTQTEEDIAETTIFYELQKYGVLEYQHIRILAILLDLHKTVASIIYRNPTLTGLFINLQFTVANYFVQMSPTNHRQKDKLTKFPFVLGDGVIEGFLLSKGCDLPLPEPELSDLFSIIVKRNTVITDIDRSFGATLQTLNKALESEDYEDMQSLYFTAKSIYEEGYSARTALKTYN